MKTILVTGAAGFVGSAVIKELINNDKRVIAIDIVDNPSQRLPIDNKNLIYIKHDISDINGLASILANYEFDTAYHFAWVGSAGPLREDYDCQINNAKLTAELLKLSKELGCNRFISAGTIMEYETFSAVYNQGTKPQMSYIYGVGKQLAHSICKPLANKLGVDLIWAYITNAFGVGELSPRLINSTIRKCINGEELNFSSGTQNYDFLYIDDVARAFYLLGEKGKADNGYIIGSGRAGPLREFLEKLVSVCNEDAKPNFGSVPFTGTNLSLETFSIKQIQDDCGFVPEVSFEEGVKKTFEWLKQEEGK